MPELIPAAPGTPSGGNDTPSRTRANPRAAGAVTARGAQPSPRCGYCHRVIFMARNGEWYHERNASTSCKPGEGSDRRAFPRGERA